jgi:hypothetical protein
VCVWCYLARFAARNLAEAVRRANLEVMSGDEKVEFDGAGGRISSLYSG